MHVVSKIRRAARMKIALEDSKRGNTAAMKERLKTVSQRKGVNEMKSLHLPCPTGLMTTADTPPRVKYTPYMDRLDPCIELAALGEMTQNT